MGLTVGARVLLVALVAAAAALACGPRAKGLPPGPPPEYEAPRAPQPQEKAPILPVSDAGTPGVQK
jgi:hypothetical protein